MNVIDITGNKNQSKTQIRFAAYCRVSSDSDDQIHSFAAQIRYYKEYECLHSNYSLVDIYADEGLTGTSMEKRDEMHRLIQDCKKGKIDRIITKSVSRFSRNTPELLSILRLLKELDVSVYFEEQDIDTDKLNMEMIVTFPGMVAQQESESISGNMRWSYKKRMESGEFNCCTPAFGYDLVNGNLVVNESEAAVIRKIFNMYLSGVGKQNIATHLNFEGIKRRYGKEKWHHNTITYILNNERYIGDALLQKSYTTETLPYSRHKNQGVVPQYYVENSHPSIISKESLQAAMNLQRSRRNDSYSPKKAYPLTRIMRCPECGRTFRRQVVAGVASWICSAQASGETECKSRRIKEAAVYDAFSVLIYKLQTYRHILIIPVIKQLELIQSSISNQRLNTHQIDIEIANLAAKNAVLARLYTNKILNSAEYTTQSTDIAHQISELRRKRKKLLSEDKENEQLESIKRLNELLKASPHTDTFSETLFEQIVQSITVNSFSSITFSLIGGLEFSETIPEKGRCKLS